MSALLSILVPVHNRSVRGLVGSLHDQARSVGIDFEILATEDGSTETFENHLVGDLEHVVYTADDQNLGRAARRNELARSASGRYLLFFDNDVDPVHPDMLVRYLNALMDHDVVAGGVVYSDLPPRDPALRLHWTYGCEREMRTLRKRRAAPNARFVSAAFGIQADVFAAHPFDEALPGYGYEDVLLGRSLLEAGHVVHHIDAPVMHLGLKTADAFLADQRTAVRQIAGRLHASTPNERSILAGSIRLVGMHERLRRAGVRKLTLRMVRRNADRFERGLRGERPRLRQLDLLKLLWLEDALVRFAQ